MYIYICVYGLDNGLDQCCITYKSIIYVKNKDEAFDYTYMYVYLNIYYFAYTYKSI